MAWAGPPAYAKDGGLHTCASCVLRYSCRRVLLVSGAARRSAAARASCARLNITYQQRADSSARDQRVFDRDVTPVVMVRTPPGWREHVKLTLRDECAARECHLRGAGLEQGDDAALAALQAARSVVKLPRGARVEGRCRQRPRHDALQRGQLAVQRAALAQRLLHLRACAGPGVVMAKVSASQVAHGSARARLVLAAHM